MSRTLRPCGTQAAYMRHLRNGESTCEPCREANNAYHRTYRTTHKRKYQKPVTSRRNALPPLQSAVARVEGMTSVGVVLFEQAVSA